MGNRSSVENVVGCKLDKKKLKGIITLMSMNGEIDYKEMLDEISKYGFEKIDSYKIYGYWYSSFVKVLYMLGECITSLTENHNDNYLELYDEEGHFYTIHFSRENGKVKVHVDLPVGKIYELSELTENGNFENPVERFEYDN